ncbi:MAG: transporter substrate-binding domain-containing protein [Leptospiraceae bacterium]|nr:transporter substrate-binding domain-containing protein [Leptospiraceae bacterium]
MISRRYLFFLISILYLTIVHLSCIQVWEKVNRVGLAEIKKRGTLKVIMAYNPNTYYIYRGEIMGFEYELLRNFSNELGLTLEVLPVKDLDNLPYMLNSMDYDLVASNVTITRKRSKQLQFSESLFTTKQVLVQRNKDTTGKAGLVTNVLELNGKTVNVRESSSYYSRLRSLQDETGIKVNIQKVEGSLSNDDLIEKVHKGELDYTITDEATALMNQTYYTDLDVSVSVSFPMKVAWVVRKNSPDFLQELNKWIYKIKSDGTMQKLKKKYYLEPKFIAEDKSEILEKIAKKKNKLSPYDLIFQREAKKIGWDWRLIAAITYQESKFKSKARSWAGATGLMQLMPSTALSLGLSEDELTNPEKNIQAGVKYLGQLDKFWTKYVSEAERPKFVLASYNAGQGHVIDARILASYIGKNPNVWYDNTELAILQLSNPKVFNRDYIQHGYCRGQEPYEYIRAIYGYYEKYKKITDI